MGDGNRLSKRTLRCWCHLQYCCEGTCIEYYKTVAHLPGGNFLTDPYHLYYTNNPRDAEAPGQEMQGAPCSHIRGSNSDDYEQNGNASGPGLRALRNENIKGSGEGLPHDPIEAYGHDIIDHVPHCEGKLGKNWQ